MTGMHYVSLRFLICPKVQERKSGTKEYLNYSIFMKKKLNIFFQILFIENYLDVISHISSIVSWFDMINSFLVRKFYKLWFYCLRQYCNLYILQELVLFCPACVCQNRQVVQRHQPPVYANWMECFLMNDVVRWYNMGLLNPLWRNKKCYIFYGIWDS